MIESIFKVVNIIFLIINGYFLYRIFLSDRKRKFEDMLYDKKLLLYQEILNKVSEISSILDYSSEPFDSIHKFDDKSEWEKYCEKEIFPLISHGMNLLEDIQKLYSLLIPEKILKILENFSMYSVRFVVESYHFEGEIILEKQLKMLNIKFDLINEMRSDLKIDLIDESLKDRLKEKIIFKK